MDRQTVAIEVKKALSETVLLSDGKRGFVITEEQDRGTGQDRWKCNVCVRVLPTERSMLMHLSHPLHMTKMRASVHPAEHFIKRQVKDDRNKKDKEDPNKKKDDKPWENDGIRPGEPVPPGMEDVVKKVCQIQATIDKNPGPLIGIEYIVELISSEDEEAEPKYICLLCEKKGDPRSVMVHLASHNHSLKYISCFFRSAGNAINMIPKSKENRKGISMAVHNIAEAIEKKFGRLTPTVAVSETFAAQKYDILRSIDEKEHFRESEDTTYLEFCSMEKIREYANQAEAELNALKNKHFDENVFKLALEEKSAKPDSHKSRNTDPPAKLSFSIGKPVRSLGRNKVEDKNKEEEEDDDVVFVPNKVTEKAEMHSMSSISSLSDDDLGPKSRERDRIRSRSRGRRSSPGRRRGSPRRRSPYRDSLRYRSRSRSRSRGRYHREIDRSRRTSRDLDRIYGRNRRSRSKDRTRYDSRGRSDRDRGRRRRSNSRDRERHRRSPRSLKRERLDSPSSLTKEHPDTKKKEVGEFKVKMDAYREKLHELEVEMDNKLKYYRSRPEKHPQYPEEWKNFWNRRYKELQQAGKDPTGYDFKPEWIIYWDEKVKELHEKEFEEKKEELKNLLPKEEEKGPSNDLQDISPPTPGSSKDITVDDIKNTWKALTGTDIKAPPKARSPTPDTRSRSPFPRRSRSPLPRRSRSPLPRRSRSPLPRKSPSPWEERKMSSHRKPVNTYSTYPIDPPIVHCLRMLSVVEQQLGSLGPKALELLSRAILMEKVNHNESMALLQESEIHIFFETVKEKIRGQLIAGIVARHLVNSCRNLINSIEGMLASHPLKPKPVIQPKPTYTPIQPEPVKVAGVGLFNKMAIAQQIAEVLVAQGRTDVSQQELEELINAVIGIASTSNTNPNQPSASFIAQLNIQQSTASSHINNLLSNLISSAQKLAPQAVQPVPEVVPQTITQAVAPTVSAEVTNSLLKTPLATASAPNHVNAFPLATASAPNPAKAFEEAVSATKSIVAEQASLTALTTSNIKEKPLKEIPVVKETEQDRIKKLSDNDLKERLLKFKTLSREEQQGLIALLKELESTELERVEKLRKYVTAGLTQSSTPTSDLEDEPEDSRLSPFSSRTGSINPAPDDRNRSRPTVIPNYDSDHEDDDDDYSVEDVYKSVSEKLKRKESDRKSDFRIDPNELSNDNNSLRSGSRVKSKSPSPYPPVRTLTSKQQFPPPAKNDYSVYSVGDTPILPLRADSLNPSSDRYKPGPPPGVNPYTAPQWPEGGWGDQNRDNQLWPQGGQETYPVSNPPNNFPPGYETRNYSQGAPPYAPTGQYYGGNAGQYDKPYGNTQSQPPYGNNQGYQNNLYEPNSIRPPQRPPGPPYNNYRQY